MSLPIGSLFARQVWLDNGWTSNVRLHWDTNGTLTQVEIDAEPAAQEPIEHYVLPGMVNLHSHAFQRAMAGMTEVGSASPDSFWTWRDLMYRFALALTPDQIEAIAAQLYSECLRHGYTAICEFHYLHRAPNGEFYDNMIETAERVIAAARHTGIGITMLPVLYSYADFGQQPLGTQQRRFAGTPEQILQMIALLEPLRDGQTEIGVAPHSLRATSTQQISTLIEALPAGRPVHIHIAEQQKEVDSCLAFSGQRPIELLFQTLHPDPSWCLVHATHVSDNELSMMAASGIVAGICTTTEANLGDGFFPLRGYINQGGRIGIGSDSHVSQSPMEELRWLEYGQRLHLQRRNIASLAGQRPIGDFLWRSTLAGGAQASGRPVGSLSVGHRADLIVLDAAHPNLNGLAPTDVLNSWIFSGNDNLVRDVMVGGQWRVLQGRHLHQDSIQARFIQTMKTLRAL